ncbi:hypothetical protein D3C84_789230 [compost metagenome]
MISGSREAMLRRVRHGRSTRTRMTAANTRRRAVVPWAPISGNRLLASEAPLWMEAMATIRTATGRRVEARRLDSEDMGLIRQASKGVARWR